MNNTIKLNLGCGRDCKLGYINIDKEVAPGVDMVLDLRTSILPFENDSVQEVLASHILEHLSQWEDLVIEIYRILKPGGLLRIHVPYGFRPTMYHVRSFLPWTLDGFLTTIQPNGLSFDAKPLFDKELRKVNRQLPFRWHLNHYLRIKLPEFTPIGRKWEIVWHLRKPVEVT